MSNLNFKALPLKCIVTVQYGFDLCVWLYTKCLENKAVKKRVACIALFSLALDLDLTKISQGISPGGGGALDFQVDGGGGAAGVWKPDPVAMRSAHKKYTLS